MKNESPKTILLVEDEAILASVNKTILEGFGYNIIHAENGEVAIEMSITNDSIQLILMDIDLGDGIDGTEAARQILKIRNVPIVFYTSHSEKEYVDRVRQITRYGYVVKNSGSFVLQTSIDMAFELFESNKTTAERETEISVIYENIPLILMLVDQKLNIYKANGIAAKFAHSLPELLVGKSVGSSLKCVEAHNSNLHCGNNLQCESCVFRKAVLQTFEKGQGVENLESHFSFFNNGKIEELNCILSTRIISIKGSPMVLVSLMDISERKKIEKKLKDHQEMLATIFSTMSEGVSLNECIFNDKGEMIDYRILEVNDAFYKIADYKDITVIGNLATTLYGLSEKFITEFWINHREKTTIAQNEMISPLNKKNFIVSTSPIKNNRFVTTFFDITERKNNEETLRDRWEQFYSIFDQLYNFGAVVLEVIFDEKNNPIDHKLLYANLEFEKMSGLKREQEIGKTSAELSFKMPKEITQQYYKVAIEGIPMHLERFNESLGRYYDISVFSPRKNQIVGLFNDISARKKTEYALQESEENYKKLIELSPDGVIIHEAGLIRYVNSAAMKLVNAKNKEDLIGKKMLDLVHPDYRHVVVTRVDNMSTSEVKVPLIEEKLVKLTGETFLAEVTATPIYFNNQKAFLVIAREITERRNAENQIKSLLEEKDIILREVHHRIKNNMSNIIGFFTLQEVKLTNPESIAILQDAQSRVRAMMILYDKLYRSNSFTETSVELYLSSLIDEIFTNFPSSKLISLEKSFDQYTLNSKILFPLGIIINEIITNTMKYAFEGKSHGILSVSFLCKEKKGVLIIQDDGIGLPDKELLVVSKGFGMQLIDLMSKQIKGTYSFKKENGTKFTLEFSLG